MNSASLAADTTSTAVCVFVRPMWIIICEITEAVGLTPERTSGQTSHGVAAKGMGANIRVPRFPGTSTTPLPADLEGEMQPGPSCTNAFEQFVQASVVFQSRQRCRIGRVPFDRTNPLRGDGFLGSSLGSHGIRHGDGTLRQCMRRPRRRNKGNRSGFVASVYLRTISRRADCPRVHRRESLLSSSRSCGSESCENQKSPEIIVIEIRRRTETGWHRRSISNPTEKRFGVCSTRSRLLNRPNTSITNSRAHTLGFETLRAMSRRLISTRLLVPQGSTPDSLHAPPNRWFVPWRVAVVDDGLFTQIYEGTRRATRRYHIA